MNIFLAGNASRRVGVAYDNGPQTWIETIQVTSVKQLRVYALHILRI